MQKFDWNTFDATQDRSDGPVVLYAHDDEGLLSSPPEDVGRSSNAKIAANMFCAVLLCLGLVAMKLAVS
ncbi:hypothetical protein PX554_20190 [Sphingomonas sp. H39-1-10]|uniref:hypothetical protein n=1 Tax=Sphingomonas pollutisoli TaxID=3030829 RepID=UPI0023B98B0A|nr:hypothetical protein [Sphingomonas pollutisoli]MDF0490454.1 hypothetical protein [Sphingomonas pollutisoli]